MPAPGSLALPYTGVFDLALSLRTAGRGAFVDAATGEADGGLATALRVERGWGAVAVRIEQRDGGETSAHVVADPDHVGHEPVREQVRRMLGLDVDARGFDAVVESAGVRDLAQRFRGLRPVQFASPYEAAARAIIGHRLAVRQAAAITARIAEEHGTRLETERGPLFAFPAPSRLADLPSEVRGLSARKVDQLRGLGAAAADGRFDSARLREMDQDDAMDLLETLAGIGAFSAELVLIRGAGAPDVFPRTEHRLHAAMAQRYDVDADDLEALERIAEAWRPYRSWVGLMLREA